MESEVKREVRDTARSLWRLILSAVRLPTPRRRSSSAPRTRRGSRAPRLWGVQDLEPYLDDVIKATMDQELIPKVARSSEPTGKALSAAAEVSQLSEIVFVQSVETPALSVVMPLLLRGLKDRDERTKRRALVIADNMCKLVPDVTEVQPFLATLIPLVERCTGTVSDPEVRSVANRCLQTLRAADRAERRRFIAKESAARLDSRVAQSR